ncbi:MAG: ASCH domain-containing protein [Ruminococcus flavefaciens]|nr:ASCH domain-containing protein [Ruminococcus flavefaciens]
MIHRMHLKNEPFQKISDGRKTVELRLNDEKRKQIKTGDYIEFSHLDSPDEKLTVEVIALHHFDSFRQLYAEIPKEKMGYKPEEIPDPDHMDDFYPREKQEQYGVLGIEFIRL